MSIEVKISKRRISYKIAMKFLHKRVEKLNAASKQGVDLCSFTSNSNQPLGLDHLAKAASAVKEGRFPEQKKPLTSERLNKAAVSSISKKHLKLPPIKGSKTLAMKQSSTHVEGGFKKKKSPHAREHASAVQQHEPISAFWNKSDVEDPDEEEIV